jgi:hypothetical protein
LIERVHPAGQMPSLFHRLPLTLRPFGARREPELRCARAACLRPSIWRAVVLAAHGLGLSERAALIADYRAFTAPTFRTPPAQTVAQYFARTPLRAFAAVWEPLCISALNTPPDTASAQVFANVLRMAIAGTARGSDFLVPATDLAALFPDPAARLVMRHGGVVRMGVAVRRVARRDAASRSTSTGNDETFDAAIIAVAPHQLAATIGDGAGAEDYNGKGPLAQVGALSVGSITTIYLAYADAVTLPLPILRLDDAPGQWVFDRAGMPVADRAPRRARAGRRGHQHVRFARPARISETLAAEATPSCEARRPMAAACLVTRDLRATRHLCVHARCGASGSGSHRAPASFSPATTPTRSFRRRSKRRRGRVVRRRERFWRITTRQSQDSRADPLCPSRAAGERALPVRLRISRCCSRAHSRSLIVARLSYCFLPFREADVELHTSLAVMQIERHERITRALDLPDEDG